jgi:signal peptidase I
MSEDYFAYPSPHQQQPKQSLKDHFVELFQTLVVFATIATIIYWLIAQPHKVSGSSMFPNFKDGDYIITDKVSYKFHGPERGDVVVFRNPRDESQDFIKRIIAIPGDRVKVENNRVYVNDKLIDEPYLRPEIITYPQSFMRNGEEVVVEPDHYVVFGDNRPHSSDSREWGFVKKNEIIGRVFLRYWPKDEIGVWPAAYSIKL